VQPLRVYDDRISEECQAGILRNNRLVISLEGNKKPARDESRRSANRGLRAFSSAWREPRQCPCQKVIGDRTLHRLRQDRRRRGYRGIGGSGTDVGERLRFGERDLALRRSCAADDEIFHLGLGFRRDPPGFGPGVGDDFLGLALRAGAPWPCIPASSLAASSFRRRAVVEFRLECVSPAMVERLEHPCGGCRDRQTAPSG